MVESLPANAGDVGSSPGLGGSHMPRSSWARAPQLLSLRVWSLCSATGEATIVRDPRTTMKSERATHRDEEWLPLAATRESPRAEMKTQHSQKLKKKKKKKCSLEDTSTSFAKKKIITF